MYGGLFYFLNYCAIVNRISEYEKGERFFNRVFKRQNRETRTYNKIQLKKYKSIELEMLGQLRLFYNYNSH